MNDADMRPAPTERLAGSAHTATVEALSDRERGALALTLRDMDGWGTLSGLEWRFDPQSGEKIVSPVKLIGFYDRTPRRGLPAGWIDLLIRLGWLDIVHLGNGLTVWKPTQAGVEAREQWLPEHLKGQ